MMSILQDLNPENAKIEPRQASAGTKILWILTLGLIPFGLYSYLIDKVPPTGEKDASAVETLSSSHQMPPVALNTRRDNPASQGSAEDAATIVSVALTTETPTPPGNPLLQREGVAEVTQPANYSPSPAPKVAAAVTHAQATKQSSKKKVKKEVKPTEKKQVTPDQSKVRDVKIIDAIMQ